MLLPQCVSLLSSFPLIRRLICYLLHFPRSGTSISTSSTSDLVTALRASLSEQAKELEEMRELVHQLQAEREEEVSWSRLQLPYAI